MVNGDGDGGGDDGDDGDYMVIIWFICNYVLP